MKQWNIKSTPIASGSKVNIEEIVEFLLKNRGLQTKKEIEEFLNPKREDVTITSVGIDKKEVVKTIERIKKAIDNKEQIVVFGDYDVDGITATAILWETLFALGAKISPYIPHRIEEGYGLSVTGISNVQSQIPNVKLIITVDNGIVAQEAVAFANKQGIDVIITDHHVPSSDLPNAYAIVHTTKLCGAGVAYLLSQEISNSKFLISNQNTKYKIQNTFLDLVALATVADLVPLTGANRALLKAGLPALKNTTRVGLLELYKEAGVEKENIDVYAIGHIIAPRLNAMGRLESAMDSMRLLCTKKKDRGEALAQLLGKTNKERQLLTQAAGLHAIERIKNQESRIKKILILVENYEEGIIGLVAGKLVEAFYRPAIVISIGEKISKASARSVTGVNIIEFIRSSLHLLINAGGHPMAAGFTIATEKITQFVETVEKLAQEQIVEEHLVRILRIDCELPLQMVSQELYAAIAVLAPFGMGNPEPVFVTKNVKIEDIRIIGKDRKHVKLVVSSRHPELVSGSHTKEIADQVRNDGKKIEGIGFGMADAFANIKIGNAIDIVYSIDQNTWQGRKKLQLKIKDIKINSNTLSSS